MAEQQPYRGIGEWWAAQRRAREAEARATESDDPTSETDKEK